MLKTKVTTYKYKIGKNRYIVINISQAARASADSGNVLASNALNVKIFEGKGDNKTKAGQKKRR
ncbi:hypothetical protein [Paenibacillus sp. J22TS3]|uniref:hypothetical protein n=1 Tax=Paenibacillus sp. J22TS3 TaxID=2807192 RepID=UPI001BD10197|nr:hypothetical protein [Paenibacillus sp. J22TS3]